MGVFVESTTTNAQARLVLNDPAEHVDVVISDIGRDSGESGLELLNSNPGVTTPPVIFYVGTVNDDRGVPPGSFGITARPDELLDLVMDAIERLPTDRSQRSR